MGSVFVKGSLNSNVKRVIGRKEIPASEQEELSFPLAPWDHLGLIVARPTSPNYEDHTKGHVM